LRLLNKSRAFLAGTWGLWAVFSLILISCPINLPEKVQIKASPSLYMPVGNLLGIKTKDLGGLDDLTTNLDIDSSDSNTLVYDYQGPEYGGTKVIMVVMKLIEQSFESLVPGLNILLPAPYTTPKNMFAGTPAPPGNNIDLSKLLGVLEDYPGLEFRSVPAYLYISGPARFFQDDNVHIELKFKDSSPKTLKTYDGAVEPLALPDLPAAPGPVTFTLPKPGMVIPLEDIFNAAPAALKVEFGFDIGQITIKDSEEHSKFIDQLKKSPLTAHLVLLLPFQFRAAKPIPVLDGSDAMELVKGGGDLLGRGSGGDSMDEIMKNLGAISIETTVVNNLGINGYALMLKEMPTESLPPDAPLPKELGKINLSGKSMLTITKADLGEEYFSPVLEIYLEGDFDIPLPEEGAMTMSMAMILRTDIDMTL
jgi:hypothetical protein